MRTAVLIPLKEKSSEPSFILARASGGWTAPKENQAAKDAPKAQLYDMANDPAEQSNLYLAKPEIAEQLLADLTADVNRGRSTKGPRSKNDVSNIVLWKSEQKKKSNNKKK